MHRIAIHGTAWLTVALASTACGLTDPDASSLDVQGHYSVWLAHRPAAYAFEVNRRCDCPDDVERPTWIRVEGDQPVEVRDVETGEALSTTGLRAITVDDIFIFLLEHMAKEASHLTVGFDVEHGFPTQANGWVTGSLADEFTFTIVDFEPDDG